MYLTTGHHLSADIQLQAEYICRQYNFCYLPRQEQSLQKLFSLIPSKELFVLSKEGLHLYTASDTKSLFFHPSTALFRLKRLLKGESEAFIEAIALQQGGSFLDCTLGLGTDSIVASHLVGAEGQVIGVEANRSLAILVKEGLLTRSEDLEEINAAMRRVKVEHSEHLTYLKVLPTASIDTVYFDPMFHKPIEQSPGIKPLRALALMSPISAEAVEEAYRVARCRIVMKENSPKILEELGFKRLKKGKILYGIINKR
jgi:16S rRNA (guanine1516-N2)-methyltransferase